MELILATLFAVYLSGALAACGASLANGITDYKDFFGMGALSWLAFGFLACRPDLPFRQNNDCGQNSPDSD